MSPQEREERRKRIEKLEGQIRQEEYENLVEWLNSAGDDEKHEWVINAAERIWESFDLPTRMMIMKYGLEVFQAKGGQKIRPLAKEIINKWSRVVEMIVVTGKPEDN